jgi:hypothetical protein
MSNTIHSQEPLVSEEQSPKPLDEAVWCGGSRNISSKKDGRAVGRIKTVNWACIGVLLVAVVVSSYVSTFYVSTYQAVV